MYLIILMNMIHFVVVSHLEDIKKKKKHTSFVWIWLNVNIAKVVSKEASSNFNFH